MCSLRIVANIDTGRKFPGPVQDRHVAQTRVDANTLHPEPRLIVGMHSVGVGQLEPARGVSLASTQIFALKSTGSAQVT